MEYIKPELEIKEINLSEMIASGVEGWLSDNGMSGAGITSFLVNS